MVLGKTILTKHRILAATMVCAIGAWGQQASGKSAPCGSGQQSAPMQQTAPQSAGVNSVRVASPSPENVDPAPTIATPEIPCTPQPLFDLTDSDVKFRLEALMSMLRDGRHENWVLAAYPDPKTSRPLIGAGFSLDVEATEHLQSDPVNPHTFLEPSSAQLWEAAGLDPARLQAILDEYDRELKAWKKKNFRRKIKTHQLSPQLSNEDATKLLRISVVQSVHNARAYCREFDQLTPAQQMALSQLVYQMGVNLEEFTQFLNAINDASYRAAVQDGSNREAEAEHWKTVQSTLVHSQWARRYSTRAISVIAMFNPGYDANPTQAEHQVRAELHPPVHHHKKAHASSVNAESHASPVHKGM